MKRLEKEDPTFEWKIDEETGQTIISGMGELHLEIISGRLLNFYRVEAKVGKPRVSYKQTLAKEVETEGRFEREQGGVQHFAAVKMRFEPWPGTKEASIAFESKIPSSKLEREFVKAVEEGVISTAQGGVGWGYPLVNFKATLLEAEVNEHSTEVAFSAAASLALRKATEEENTQLLEPIMLLEITTPEESVGDLLQDLHSRKADILEMKKEEDLTIIRCTVPLAKMFGYSTDIRSLSQGRASFTMEPYQYAPVHPDDIPSFY
ncbi:MAG: hypothetical protein D6785_07510 [Planctomycetota bacterium]|nr:MAG: hypothetical protein D6785_07510 [Planctomycetota bacterium]